MEHEELPGLNPPTSNDNFYGDLGYGATPGADLGQHLARRVTQKLERQRSHRGAHSPSGSGNNTSWDVEDEWSDCVNLYCAVQRDTGIILILFAAIITSYLAYCVTLVRVATQTAALLSDLTNFGIVQDAFENMDVCETCQ